MADAGEVKIQIDADWAALLAKLDQVESASKTAGTKSADGFAAKFNASYQRFGERLSNKMGQFLSPERVVGALADGFRKFNETGDVSDALEGAVKNIPLVGAAYDLGTQAGQTLADAFMGKAENLLAKADIGRAAGMENEAAQHQRAADIEFQIQMELAREIGDERTMLRLETEKKAAEAQLAFEEANRNSTSDEEMRLLQQNFDRQKELDIYLHDLKYSAIERKEAEIAAEKQKLADDAAMKAEEAAQRIAEKEAEVRKRADEDRQKDLERELAREMDDWLDAMDASDKERRDAADEIARQEEQAQQITGSASTAIGSFKFDAYSQSDKKRNDERIANGVEKLVAVSAGSAGGFT